MNKLITVMFWVFFVIPIVVSSCLGIGWAYYNYIKSWIKGRGGQRREDPKGTTRY